MRLGPSQAKVEVGRPALFPSLFFHHGGLRRTSKTSVPHTGKGDIATSRTAINGESYCETHRSPMLDGLGLLAACVYDFERLSSRHPPPSKTPVASSTADTFFGF